MKKLPDTIKLVVFDLDGTLADAYQAICDSINFMMRRMGKPRQRLHVVKRSVGHGVDGLIRCFVEEKFVDEALMIFREHHDKRLRDGIKLLPGAKKVLAALKKRGCRMAIASNRPARFCHIILKQLKIGHYFDWVICGDAVKHPKPYPDMLKLILKNAGVKASEVLYVGDMTVDIECGRRAKVFTIAVPTGSSTLTEIKACKPGLIIPGLRQFPLF